MTAPDETVAITTTELRALATELQKAPDLDPATIRKGVITAVNTGGSPPTVTVNLSGDTTTPIADVRYLEPYFPTVNDTVLMIKQGTALVVLNKVEDAYVAPGTTDYFRRSRTTTQSISNATITKAILTTADVNDTTTVTVSTDRDFTLVRAGVHTVQATVPWQSHNLGSRWAFIGLTSDSATRYAVSELNPSNAAFPIHNISVTRRFAANTVLSLWVFQDCGSSLSLGPGSGIAPLDLNITYIKP